ncbi:MAG: carotenoid oxygenase family protein [Microscillaceae bacterium]|jgi:carotenoid cleavage dioxygenase-like enzyme|nr:carotenoid oxygenase family protein [Microscillaceae bacterium]
MQPIISASREELAIQLNVKEGKLPEDIYGVVYLTSPSGSVNSNGLPFPEFKPDGSNNQEYGSPLMNGDGMIFKIDFNTQGQANLQTVLMKTPCFYADQATGWQGVARQNPKFAKYGFRNAGIARMSLFLGARNELNTAIVPFQFAGDAQPRILATYDVGRPFEIGAQSMKLLTPIGKNTEWTPGTPPIIKMPFPLVQSTAHPVFDPKTGEFFMVNYTKSLQTMLSSVHFLAGMLSSEEELEKHLEDLADEFEQHHSREKSLNDLQKSFQKPPGGSIWDKIKIWLEKLIAKATETEDGISLMRWNGKPGNLDKWNIVDQTGKNLVIEQCMHQMGLTQDYIILADSSFKFAIDILINNPFPNNYKIDRFIRAVTASPMLPYLSLYLVKRADLQSGKKQITAIKLNQPIPIEAVHFSADYLNPNHQITVYLAHNTAACMAEWLRPFDTLGINPSQPVEKDLLGMFAIGAMDIGRIGKFVIDGNTGAIVAENILHATGNLQDIDHIGAHTWELGLYTYRDIISPNKVVDKIENMYFICYGLDPRMLTQFIEDLYSEYPNRIVPKDQILKYTAQGLPSALIRVNMNTMQIEDFWQYPIDFNMRSIQFVPRKGGNPNDSQDGYILVSSVNVVAGTSPKQYTAEIWLFDAANLAQGPICKLVNSQMTFAFTLHSAWLETAQDATPTYKINIQEDYNALIKQFFWPGKRKNMQAFFDQYVYPYFK